jgi:hypothetical protein
MYFSEDIRVLVERLQKEAISWAPAAIGKIAKTPSSMLTQKPSISSPLNYLFLDLAPLMCRGPRMLAYREDLKYSSTARASLAGRFAIVLMCIMIIRHSAGENSAPGRAL